MIPNPKKEIVVDYKIENVKLAVEKISKINTAYKLDETNDIMKMYTFSAFELLSLGVYIDISLKPFSDSSTSISIEVRRKVGAFDEPHEISNANNHITTILSDISELLVNPNLEKSTKATKDAKATSKTINVIRAIVGWTLGLIVLAAAFQSKMPLANVVIFIVLVNKSLRTLFSKLFPEIAEGLNKNK